MHSVIRATRNTFNEERKLAFIRELAAEGFIADYYRWWPVIGQEHDMGVRWLVDYSWLELSEQMPARMRRFMLRLLGVAALLWLVLMTALFLRAAG